MSEQQKVYPRWKYHKEKPPQIVKNAQHEEKLGEDWEDTPAAFGTISCPSAEQVQALAEGRDPHEVEKEDVPQEQEVKEEEEQVNVPRRRR